MELLLLKDNPNIKTTFKSYKPKNGKSESDLKHMEKRTGNVG